MLIVKLQCVEKRESINVESYKKYIINVESYKKYIPAMLK